MGDGGNIEVEVRASQPVTPETQIIANPDRLLLDFPNALPGSDLHNLAVNRGEVKGIRVGLFSANPPITRVVVDLKSPQPYRVLPSGNSIVLRVGTGDVKLADTRTREAMPVVAKAAESKLLTPRAPARDSSVPTIRRVAVMNSGQSVEVEIAASQPVVPQTQVATGPDRLMVDFPNAVPATELRDIAVDRGDVKGIRVGLFSANPPVTRIVLDLKGPREYQVFPSGKSVIVKLRNTETQPAAIGFVTGGGIVSTLVTPKSAIQPPAPPPRVRVGYQNGKLSIWAEKATLAEVLLEVHRRTGADIPIPSGADREQVVANFPAGPVREVLASLLNGSPYDFVLVGSDQDPSKLSSVLLTRRANAGLQAPAFPVNSQPAVTEMAPQPEPEVQPEPQPDLSAPPVQPETPPEPPPQPEQPPQQ